jgi:hypothetical protein
MNILPRQPRDKHRENSKKCRFLAAIDGAQESCGARPPPFDFIPGNLRPALHFWTFLLCRPCWFASRQRQSRGSTRLSPPSSPCLALLVVVSAVL